MTKIALIQMWLSGKTKEEMFRRADELIDQNSDADLIMLPEMWSIGWRSFDRYEQEAETLQGETISRLSEKAKKIGSYIHSGSIVEKTKAGLFNTAVLIDPSGKVIAAYRKIHLVTRKGSEEAAYLKSGNKVVAVDTDFGKVGFGICYDLRFPELYRKMAVEYGVEIFLHVAAWPLVRVENWTELGHARANENLAYFLACNCAGFDKGVQYLGHSSIVDQHGTSVAATGLFEDVVRGSLDVESIRKSREQLGHLNNIALSV